MNNEEKRAMWHERIESYKARQGSAEDWCIENNIPLSTLRYWVTKLNKEHQEDTEPTQWLPVEVENSSEKSHHGSNPNSTGVRIDIGNASIHISSDFDPESLETVIKVLKKC